MIRRTGSHRRLIPESPLPRGSQTIAGELAKYKPLTDLYLEYPNPQSDPTYGGPIDCTNILSTEAHEFLLWPDAAKHALIMEPVGLAYVFTACEVPTEIPVATLLKLQLDPGLIAALAAN